MKPPLKPVSMALHAPLPALRCHPSPATRPGPIKLGMAAPNPASKKAGEFAPAWSEIPCPVQL
ncbi:MAG: hypothetical protein ACLQU4_00640 [Limisphaerales bacterium]